MEICVFGSAASPSDSVYYDRVIALGKEIAARGHSIIFGGGKNGLMGAAAIGANQLGGEIIGIAPAFMGPLEMPYLNCTQFIRTDTMAERKAFMEDSADAFIAVPGGIGTLDEVFEVMVLRQLGRLPKPIAFFNVNGFYDKLFDFLNDAYKLGIVHAQVAEVFDDPKKLVDYLEEAQGKIDSENYYN